MSENLINTKLSIYCCFQYRDVIKFVISNKENDEQFKSNLKNFYLLSKTRPSYMAV